GVYVCKNTDILDNEPFANRNALGRQQELVSKGLPLSKKDPRNSSDWRSRSICYGTSRRKLNRWLIAHIHGWCIRDTYIGRTCHTNTRRVCDTRVYAWGIDYVHIGRVDNADVFGYLSGDLSDSEEHQSADDSRQ